MDKQREKLIELLQNVPANKDGSIGVGAIADHLLVNGVIVPPCKIGGKVYALIHDDIPEERWYISEETVIGVGLFGLSIASYTSLEADDPGTLCKWDEFGVEMFFSREDAEKALEERKDKGK